MRVHGRLARLETGLSGADRPTDDAFLARALPVHADLVPRRRGEAAPGLAVPGLGVVEERRDAPGQQRGRLRHVRPPTTAGSTPRSGARIRSV